MHDRELSLFDGSRLLGHDRFDKIMELEEISEEEMNKRLERRGEVI